MRDCIGNEAGDPDSRVQVTHEPVGGLLDLVDEVVARAEVHVIVLRDALAKVPHLLHEDEVGREAGRVLLELVEDVLEHHEAFLPVAHVVEAGVQLELDVSLEEAADEAHRVVVDGEFGDAKDVDARVFLVELAGEHIRVPDTVLRVPIVFGELIAEVQSTVFDDLADVLGLAGDFIDDALPSFNFNVGDVCGDAFPALDLSSDEATGGVSVEIRKALKALPFEVITGIVDDALPALDLCVRDTFDGVSVKVQEAAKALLLRFRIGGAVDF